MEHHIIPARHSTIFPALVRQYLEGNQDLQALLDQTPDAERLEQIRTQFPAGGIRRLTLSETLMAQYARLHGHIAYDAVETNLKAIGQDNTFVICTGQQIHPLLGPLFVFYKIWSCIDQAKKWSENFPKARFIPVFWMASEDHDFEEIKDVRLYGDIFSWEQKPGGPVGRLSTAGLTELVDRIQQRSDDSPEHRQFFDLCRYAYSHYPNLADATRHILHNIFGMHGLLVLDPDDARLKSLFVPHMKYDILQHGMQPLIREGIDAMKKLGAGAPINGRPINHFYLFGGSRERIITDSGGFTTSNGEFHWSSEELSTALEQIPENFSPNALLRPLYQQSILPCAAYICGSSEIQYWWELGTVFRKRMELLPKLILRNSAFFIGTSVLNKIARENIQLADLFLEDSKFQEIFAKRQNEEWREIEGNLEALKAGVEFLEGKLEWLDEKKNEQARFLKSLDHKFELLGQQFKAALDKKANESDEMEKAMKLRNKVLGNPFQERHDYCVRYIPFLLVLNRSFKRSLFNDPWEIHTFILH